ncbi:hypothetical protein [Nocardia asiatica]|uniref:hypothetical protein n=1 Tax=Nocardia asiatica TaxID=209252 RepID=UPI003EDF5E21
MVALLAALALVVSMVDCSTTRGHSHIHTSMGSAVEHVTLSLDHGHAMTAGAMDAHCPTHFDHCLAKSVLRTAPENRAPQLLIFALISALIGVGSLRGSAASGVRAPPISRLPVAAGRATLTCFCIARC